MFDSQSFILNLLFSIFYSQSFILNLLFSIFYSQSFILNLLFSIFYSQSFILNLLFSIFYPLSSRFSSYDTLLRSYEFGINTVHSYSATPVVPHNLIERLPEIDPVTAVQPQPKRGNICEFDRQYRAGNARHSRHDQA